MFNKLKTVVIQAFSQEVPKVMASARYFPNRSPDFEEGSPVSQPPLKALKKSVTALVKSVEMHIKPTEENGRDGLYLGTAGIAYMYYYLAKNPAFAENKGEFLSKAVDYVKAAIQSIKSSRDEVAFILGNSGVYCMAAAIFQKLGDEEKAIYYKQLFYNSESVCKKDQFLSCGSDELFVGRTGYIFGALWLARETSTAIHQEQIYDICQAIVKSGREYAAHNNSPCPLMYAYYQVEYLGAAHGLCTILQAVLSVPGYLDANPADLNDVKTTVDYLLSLQDSDGNFPSAVDEIQGPNILVHWCHGAAGMVYLMAKAHLLWKDEKYLRSCEKMGELIWQKGLLKKGPGICHGVAGNGYAFLLLYRLTKNQKFLWRALEFYKFMESDLFKQNARTPDNPYSLYEGVAGTACFLADLMQPNLAEFPFSDVFM